MSDRVKRRTLAAANRGSEKLVIRFPDGLKDRLAHRAAANFRTMNAEIIDALQRHLHEPHAQTRALILEILKEEQSKPHRSSSAAT